MRAEWAQDEQVGGGQIRTFGHAESWIWAGDLLIACGFSEMDVVPADVVVPDGITTCDICTSAGGSCESYTFDEEGHLLRDEVGVAVRTWTWGVDGRLSGFGADPVESDCDPEDLVVTPFLAPSTYVGFLRTQFESVSCAVPGG